ncbi:unknown [[Mannheimia] succiniciproducens MBEL55E]|uniref:Uncharacterized protein n=1 Tax=Mannheimia succiniciproducens (strain KCTC 0769BP / MBEL55E) TaxID=221988 RepID=Q65VP8_MANSM|nr:unknown [[Mannheimia] succiniciproducens MBEL55E]
MQGLLLDEPLERSNVLSTKWTPKAQKCGQF